MIRRFFRDQQDLALVLGVIAILMVLFAPIPPVLLDLLIIVNFALALTILLLTFYVARPVDFSTFPSLLLVATLFRLSLNVAATRLILTGADAGQVIGAIGRFAVQGNFVIGLVIFAILVVVQYVVVTAGAQRVSEVAARFVLDAVPGQQMSIDADLNMGLIDATEARRRRKDIEREAAFYGAMDGASKFVKGDAVAGVVILLINIIAGWIIGVSQMGMDWLGALQTFSLLTIGDGIATQVPALVISVATGIIVTRSASDRQLGLEVIRQLASVPRIPLIVMAALILLMLLPGMPKWPIALMLAIVAAAWLTLRRRAPAEATSADEEADASVGERPAPIQILLGRTLADTLAPTKPLLIERIAALRDQRRRETGFAFPEVSFRDGHQLAADGYEIRLFDARHGHAALPADHTLAIRAAAGAASIEGMPTTDPAFGLPAVWIKDELVDRARDLGYTIVDPVTVLMTHLGEVLRIEAPLLLSRGEVATMLEEVRGRQPGLIEELVPAMLTVSDVQRVLQNLLSEEVSILHIDRIAEVLVDVGRQSRDPAVLTELVRQRLAHSICFGLQGAHDELSVVSLDPLVEQRLAARAGEGGLGIEPALAEHVLRKLGQLSEKMMRQSLAPVLLCAPELRRQIKAFTRRAVPRLAVIAATEVPDGITLRSFAVLETEK